MRRRISHPQGTRTDSYLLLLLLYNLTTNTTTIFLINPRTSPRAHSLFISPNFTSTISPTDELASPAWRNLLFCRKACWQCWAGADFFFFFSFFFYAFHFIFFFYLSLPQCARRYYCYCSMEWRQKWWKYQDGYQAIRRLSSRQKLHGSAWSDAFECLYWLTAFTYLLSGGCTITATRSLHGNLSNLSV